MSKLEVDAIEPQSGTTLTLGASGDAVNIASGASITDFKSTGIDDNATSTAITIDSSENVTVTGSITFADGHFLGNGAGDNLDIISGTGENIIYKSDGGIHAFQDNSGTNYMRIDSSGFVGIGETTPTAKVHIKQDGNIASCLRLNNTLTGTGNSTTVIFQRNGSNVGTIVCGTTTAYNTTSDYRLKENVSYDFDATTRLKQLKPARFNFIEDANTTVDGFLAHEVQSIVPEAISGEKDEIETKEKVVVSSNGQVIAENIEQDDWENGKIADEYGNTQYPTDSTWEATKVVPVYQGIDQAKLVPLLVKTIQELEARITALENA